MRRSATWSSKPADDSGSRPGCTLRPDAGRTDHNHRAGQFRLLTDPAFDPPGTCSVPGRVLTKTAPSPISAGDVGRIDAVLLSHDQHVDNLDRAGRSFLDRATRS